MDDEDDLMIGIEFDSDWEPGNHSGNDAEIQEAIRKVQAGEWAPYEMQVRLWNADRDDWLPTGPAIGGFVSEAGWDGTLRRPEHITNEYLRENARNMLDDYLAQQRAAQ